ncbi:Chromatin modification-related protein eaf3 [Penicillium capsulatum]|nr:Chromatin modification-related protein eaf3 [Penicillium capsulatum]
MPASMYSKDEKVLCFHHEILYDAKILDVRHKDSSDKKSPLEYKVHYKGWKNTWDDWVLEDRLRKATDENRELAANIRREAEESVRAKSSKSGPKKRGTSERDSVRDSEERGNSVPGRGNKRARGDNDIESEEQFQTRPSIRIVMPDNLKSLIVDDWERVSKNSTVVDLPAPKSVRQILNEYRDEEAPKRAESRIDVDVLEEVIAGLLEYFDVMLDKILLYRYERPQYRQLKKQYSEQENFGPVAVYGAEHLLRLFSLLPELLAQTNMTQTGTNRMREELSKLSIWLSKNSEKYFRTEYVSATDFY